MAKAIAAKQRTEREHLEVFRGTDGMTTVTDKQSGVVINIQQSHPLMSGPKHVRVEAYSMDTDSEVQEQQATKDYATGSTVLLLIPRKVR